MSHRISRALAVVLALSALARSSAAQADSGAPSFRHAEHARLFPTCETCHAGAAQAGAAMWPAPVSCQACHDGIVEARVRWAGAEAAASNLRFDHLRHRAALTESRNDDVVRATGCVSCHAEVGAPRMRVERAVLARCLDCHQAEREHLALADTACATCHVPLTEARSLPPERVEAFGVPPSHREPGFGEAGHGPLARPSGGAAHAGVAASCATCHAREFCITCHVDAPETEPIQALGPDERSLLHRAVLTPPRSHRIAGFDRAHGWKLGGAAERCATCHTRESCLTCHLGARPRAARALAQASPGRGAGAATERRPPASHTPSFAERHADEATTAARSCVTCHVRSECRECHRPDPAAGSGFHPPGFLASHPMKAYARETSCADCHNQAQFCQSCHAQSGLTARQALGASGRYHDAKQFFLLGHGQAARQNLESCVSCHVEKDCLTCHAANVGRRFSPHGPGFDATRLRRKNPELCSTCHGLSVPPG